MNPRVEIVIEEVVLHGLRTEQAGPVVAAMTDELAALATSATGTGRLAGRDEAVVQPRMPRDPARDGPELGRRAAAAVWAAVDGPVPRHTRERR